MLYAADVVHELIQGIYRAGADAGRWPDCLERLRCVTGATSAVLTFADRESGGATIQAAAGLDPAARQLYAERYASSDPFSTRAAALGPLVPGFIGLAQDLIPEAQLMRTDYYKEFGARFGLLGGLICVVDAEGPVVASVGINRRPGRYFGEHEVRLLRDLLPHLRTAMQIHRDLLRDAQIGQAALATLDRVGCLAFVCDAGSAVLHSNAAARLALPGVRAGSPLRLPSPRETGRLHGAIARAAQSTTSGSTEDTVIPLQEGLGEPSVAVVSPVHQRGVVPRVAPMVAVLIGASAGMKDTSHGTLQALYGFTPAEARLACQLLHGDSLQRACVATRLSYETGRTYLKRIFSKTATTRQAELIRKLLGSVHHP